MKIIAIVVLVLFGTIAQAQTTPPPATKAPDILESAWNVSVSGGYANQQTNNGFATGLSLRLAQHWALRSDVYILDSPRITVALAGPEYRFNLAHLLNSTNYAASANRVEAFLNTGMGTSKSSLTTVTSSTSISKFAYSIGGGFDITLTNNVTMRPLDVKYVRSPMINNGGQLLGNHLQFAAGLGLRF